MSSSLLLLLLLLEVLHKLDTMYGTNWQKKPLTPTQSSKSAISPREYNASVNFRGEYVVLAVGVSWYNNRTSGRMYFSIDYKLSQSAS